MLSSHRGRLPRVHPSAYIDESSQVIGDVEIGEARDGEPREYQAWTICKPALSGSRIPSI